ncbi:MAPEG family protein [Thalassospira australica]|uniref:MAPEG family protein n=1 Tax=Thalassospira australica TaxID=1528106 RepID=UPI00384D1047
MTIELALLVFNALFCLVFPRVYNWSYGKQVGGKRLMGNRDNLPERQGLAARGLRAHQNHLENLVPFAIIALVGHAIGISNTVTVACAIVFTLARVAHAGFYFAGITRLPGINGVRSIAYFVSLFAMLIFASQLFGT